MSTNKFDTRAIHDGQPNDAQTGAVTVPIYQTSTYRQFHAGEPETFDGRPMVYGRTENPTRTAYENALASLEGAKLGLAYASGLAAVTGYMNTRKAGDHVIACGDLYGGCYRMFTKIYAHLGIEFTFVDTTDLSTIKAALKPNTRVLWLESPSNPLINVTDIAGAAAIVKNHHKEAQVVVDNTFASPYLQQPLKFGADLVLHSATKFLNGHADVISGVVATNDQALWDALKFVQNSCGLVPGPQDCYLVLRGMKTLSLRMERHCETAARIARFLAEHPKVEHVYYPGLQSHKGHALARKQMKLPGPMLAFALKADVVASKKFLERLTVFTLAESLGTVKSLICHPPSMTHKSVEPDVRRKVGIVDGLIRVSPGLEDAGDLIADLEQALAKV